MKEETICAVVVTYNRKELLLQCLNALKEQTQPLDALIIIDNLSEDGTPEQLLEQGYIQKLPRSYPQENEEQSYWVSQKNHKKKLRVFYIRKKENDGGAGGFHQGVKSAYTKGYDWIWLMDDDVKATPNAVENYLKYTSVSQCIHGSKKNIDGSRFHWYFRFNPKKMKTEYLPSDQVEELFHKNSYLEVNYGCFEGMFIHKNIISKIGFPDSRFFFMEDDTVYGYLASKYTKNIFIQDFCLQKMLPNKKKLSNIGTYYFLRNQFLVVEYSKKYAKLSPWKGWLYLSMRFLREIRGVLLKFKIKKLSVVLNAFYDGFMGKFGKKRFAN